MALIPYSCQTVADEDIDAVTAAMRSDFLTQGPILPAFEAAFAERHSVAHAIAVANATAALHIACLSFDIGPGTRVWTSPNSFLASANCALYCGAEVDFVDIDPQTRNMSVAALEEKLARAAVEGRLPDLVIPVDFSGLPCDLREIRALADHYGFRILQDASHATGASYLGAPVGAAWADASVFSFHAVKIVTTAEGGMVTTQDPELARKLRLLRSHGMTRDPADLTQSPEGPWVYEQMLLGYNYRMTELQAALGLSQLKRLDAMHARRIELADRYDQLLADVPILKPARLADRVSAWHLYAIEIDESRTGISRAALFDAMRSAEIGVNVHYIPIHTQPYYSGLGFSRGDFPHAERYYARAISIPLFPRLSEVQQDRVADVIRTTLGA
ncbi:MAG TPA: UDP-4-amino-4,6-dideoxy-N-acetyl-beta-L-altrosamine transaminase [Novosphingobium sp.]|nr:UDP-4-amino-4,6-dideoxy-N-acetyl-beta-L-altrosamine transaminase [Novosphingobium sp.]